jgi:hypothetical protein
MGVRKAKIAHMNGLAFIILVALYNCRFLAAKVALPTEQAGEQAQVYPSWIEMGVRV